MAYKALYRSYRPNSFGTVIGQEHIIKTFKNALTNKKTSHAYIFSGPRGIGKTTIARILAKAINCENLQDGEPCNKCASCKLINNNETPDIVEFDAASNNGVEEIRNVLEKVNFLPSVLKHKVYIIDEVHMLSISAFNALLKTLEEPPAHVMFILATTEPHKIPATILSRCQRFDFKPLTVKEIKTNLVKIAERENISIEEEALNLVAEASEGGMRDAIGILDQVNSYSTNEITLDDVNNVTGRISNQKLIELMQALNEANSTKAIELTNDLLSLGKEVSRLVQSLLQIVRDILLYQSTDGEADDKLIYDDMAFKMLCNTMNKKKLFYYIDVLSDVQNKIKFSLSQKIFLEVGIMKMANATKEDYDAHVVVDGAGMVVSSSDNDEKVNLLEAQFNKLKSELVKLNLHEFKEETKNKLNSLEDMATKTIYNNPSNDLEERIVKLENQESPTNVNLDGVYEEINLIKNQLNGNNNDENNEEVNQKLSSLENKTNELVQKLDNFENREKDVNTYVNQEEFEKIEASIQLAFNQLDELSMNLKEINKQNDVEPTLFDFNEPNNSEELEELKQKYQELKHELEELKHAYNNVEAALNELILADEVVEPTIQKRENPYEQKVLDIVEAQRELEEDNEVQEEAEEYPHEEVMEELFPVGGSIPEEIEETEEYPHEEIMEELFPVSESTPEEKPFYIPFIEEKQEELVTEVKPEEEVMEELYPETVEISQEETPIEELFPESVEETVPLEEVAENKPFSDEQGIDNKVNEAWENYQEQENDSQPVDVEEAENEEEEVELPEEMTRSIDDFFTNPVFFNKPLEEPVVEEKVAEEVKEEPIKPEPVKVEVKAEPNKNGILSIDDFERVVEEEKHYDLSCNVKELEYCLRVVANSSKEQLDELNHAVVNLYGMKDDINMFIKDKQTGVHTSDPLLEKDANKNIKTFLITISVRDAMVSATKDKELKKLIEEIKGLIKEFRNAKEGQTTYVEPTPVVKPIEEPIQVEEKVVEPVVEKASVESPVEEAVEQVVEVEDLKETSIESPVEEVAEQVVEVETLEETPAKEEPVQEEPVVQKPAFTVPTIEEKEVEKVQEEAPIYKRSTVLETKSKTVAPKVDEDNPYAIEKIEMVMHDSRSEISREERKIILNNWRHLGDRIGTALSPVARFLMDGVPVVNGNNCIIITYPNAALCNHIMGDKIRFEAKQILKITFGREYDFIALPENIWQEKRNEYRGQYQMGTRYPKLTPINNPELKIIKKSFVNEKSASYNKAVDLFGENLIKEEEE